MKSEKWELVKGLQGLSQTISLVYYFQYSDETFPNIEDPFNHDGLWEDYVNRNIDNLFGNKFAEEVDFNLNFLEPEERVKYLLEIAEFLYDGGTDIYDNELFEAFESESFDENSYALIVPKNKFTEEVQMSIKNETNVSLSYIIYRYVKSGVVYFYKNELKSINISIQNARSMRNLMGRHERVVIDKRSEETIEPIDLKHINHKVLLLDELGIITYLTDSFPSLKIDRNSTLAKFLYSFFRDPDKGKDATIDTTRKALEGILSSKEINKYRTPDAMKKVKLELQKFDIIIKV